MFAEPLLARCLAHSERTTNFLLFCIVLLLRRTDALLSDGSISTYFAIVMLAEPATGVRFCPPGCGPKIVRFLHCDAPTGGLRPADQRIIATYFAIVIPADPLLACGFAHLGADRKLSAFCIAMLPQVDCAC
jgi:hypothetical protein